MLYEKGRLDVLGRWGPVVDMPNHYDCEALAAELSRRGDILNRFIGGWRPAHAYEIPGDGAKRGVASMLHPPTKRPRLQQISKCIKNEKT